MIVYISKTEEVGLPARSVIIIIFCLLAGALAVETTPVTAVKPAPENKSDWPIVTDKATGIELEFPGDFVPLPPTEGMAFGGQSPDGTAAMAVISSPAAKVESPEAMLATAMSFLSITQLDPQAREELSSEDNETFQVESGFREEFTAQHDGKPVNGVMQYIVYNGRSALIIAWCNAELWEQVRPIILFSLDTTYIW
jgi:hypothetical protein